MPQGMRERIAIEAQRNGRSMNAEIVSVLEDHFPPAPSLPEIFEQLNFLIRMHERHDETITRREIMSALNVLKIKLDELQKGQISAASEKTKGSARHPRG
nr:Arc family DNA-binding protein [Mesorhizobium sp.]